MLAFPVGYRWITLWKRPSSAALKTTLLTCGLHPLPITKCHRIGFVRDAEKALRFSAVQTVARGPPRRFAAMRNLVASLIGRCGSSAFRLSTAVVVDVSRGLALLFGLGTKALPSWESRTRWNNLTGGLAFRGTAGPSDQTNSPHPSSREGHHSTAGWSSSFLLSDVILYGFHAATACSLVQRNSVPSTQMRCMITANRRASATIAFFIPRCLAIFIAQALSQDHLLVRVSMTWAAS